MCFKIQVQNGVVINFEKIGPDPPPISDKLEDNKDDVILIRDENEMNANDKSGIPVPSIPNTSWYNCRKMIYVPRTTQKGYPLGENISLPNLRAKFNLFQLISLTRLLADT